jgi:glycosyltransferase involved in cell wall biosynthesis
MVTTFYPPHHFGGDATYVYRLSNELAQRGHRVTVVCSPDAFHALGGSADVDPASHPNVVVRRLESRPTVLGPLVTYLSGRPGLRTGSLRRLFERERYDVVHFHNVSLVGGPGVLAYGDGTKLYTTHEHWLVCPMHTLWRLDRETCERPTCLRCTLAYRRPPQLWRYGSLLERSAREVDLYLSPSRFTIEMHQRRGFDRPMRHLPPFIPEAPAPETPAQVGDDGSEPPYFLVVARLEKLKGVQTLVELFAGYDKAELLVVGDGTYGAELRRQAAGLEHVRFLGSVPFYELASLYARAVAVIAPSVGYETFGMTTIEGFVQKTPAIVRDLGGLPEAVIESGGGFTYRTQHELLEAMESLRSKPELRAELGERGFQAYRERWSPEPHLKTYFELIDEATELRTRRVEANSRAGVKR